MVDPKLLTLVKIAELGSYTKAAAELSLTQPAVSQHVKSLEKECGARLIRKEGSLLSFTSEGELVLKYARRIISLYKDMDSRLKDQDTGKRTYTVGVTHTAESNLIAESLGVYASRHHGVRIKIKADSIKKLYQRLSAYELDFAIIDGKAPGRKYSSVLLDTDRFLAVLAKDSPLAAKKVLQVGDLSSSPLILRSRSSETRTLLEAALESSGYSLEEFDVFLELDNIATIKELVARGRGISVLPRSACYGELDSRSLALRPIENLDISRETNLVFPSDFSERAVLEEIVDIYHGLIGH